MSQCNELHAVIYLMVLQYISNVKDNDNYILFFLEEYGKQYIYRLGVHYPEGLHKLCGMGTRPCQNYVLQPAWGAGRLLAHFRLEGCNGSEFYHKGWL